MYEKNDYFVQMEICKLYFTCSFYPYL